MKKAGIYIHIPFCAIKCMYCDFYSVAERNDQIPSFIETIVKEIEIYDIENDNLTFDTIFIGGGTPSMIDAFSLEKIINALDKKLNLSNISEFTIEANPGEAPKERLKDFLDLGVNRLSIGVQSLHQTILTFLTRIHNAEQVLETFRNARQVGFNNISCDLIYCVPNQTWKMWEKDLNQIISLEPDHISAYNLTVENGTTLFDLVKTKQIIMPFDDECSDWFLKTHQLLEENKYKGYEISNFSKDKMECKHNIHYWEIDPYLAFGPSAHGFDGEKRWNNVRSLNKYMQKIESGKSPISKLEHLSEIDLLNEALGFGLRMKNGFDIRLVPSHLLKKFRDKLDLVNEKYLDLIKIENDFLILTINGMVLSDQIIPELLFE